MFSELIKLDKEKSHQSMLVSHLILRISEEIKVTKEDLRIDAFKKPTPSTLIYEILFNDSFTTIPVHEKIVDELASLWEEWKNNGFEPAEVKTWTNLKQGEQEIVCQIWNKVGECKGKQMDFKQLISRAVEKRERITTIKANVTSCIQTYCQGASDKKVYEESLQSMEEDLNNKKEHSIKVPKNIKDLQPFANRLSPVRSSHSWQNFLKKESELQGKIIR